MAFSIHCSRTRAWSSKREFWSASRRQRRRRGNDVPVEHPAERDREAVGRLVIQYRVERAAKRVAWFAAISLLVALILSVPGVGRLVAKLMQT